MAGFSLFGKNIGQHLAHHPGDLGCTPRCRKEPFGKYAAVALLATALAPVVSYIILDNGWGTPVLGVR